MDPILLIEIIQMATMIVRDSNCRTAVAQFELRQAVKHNGWKPSGPSIRVTTWLYIWQTSGVRQQSFSEVPDILLFHVIL